MIRLLTKPFFILALLASVAQGDELPLVSSVLVQDAKGNGNGLYAEMRLRVYSGNDLATQTTELPEDSVIGAANSFLTAFSQDDLAAANLVADDTIDQETRIDPLNLTRELDLSPQTLSANFRVDAGPRSMLLFSPLERPFVVSNFRFTQADTDNHLLDTDDFINDGLFENAMTMRLYDTASPIGQIPETTFSLTFDYEGEQALVLHFNGGVIGKAGASAAAAQSQQFLTTIGQACETLAAFDNLAFSESFIPLERSDILDFIENENSINGRMLRLKYQAPPTDILAILTISDVSVVYGSRADVAGPIVYFFKQSGDEILLAETEPHPTSDLFTGLFSSPRFVTALLQ